MPKSLITISLIAVGLMMAATATAFAQNMPAPANNSSVTAPAAPGMAQKRQAEARDKELQERSTPPRESDRPAIGPRTTQGLAQDAITRSNGR